jgi:SprT protein
MQQQQQQIRDRVAQCIALAEQKFGISMPTVDVRFDLRGRAAGMACMRGNQFFLRFNVNHMKLGGKTWEHLLNETVPHEVAHTVCQAFPLMGRRHDAGWRRVCIALGGNGSRCYSAEDAPEAIAQQRPYVYTTTAGRKCPVSAAIHKRIQAGRNYTMKNGGGQLTAHCQYEYAGNTVKPAVAVTQHTVQVPPKQSAPTSGASKADLVRARIAQAKSRAENSGVVVQWAIDCLGMSRSMAQTYVRNNWQKV